MKEKEPEKDEKKEEGAAAGAEEEESKPTTIQSPTTRSKPSLMYYGEPIIRKSVPLAIGLVSVS
ncbi:hypothetical protein R3P38DRAFT_3220617 [Favolaschia claudopus]|uniref:Uncharacterized protein n=1 Tax=Favolaschia claudopus TaxID=2862362 RepID=A0AAV9ZAU0_9AGAR